MNNLINLLETKKWVNLVKILRSLGHTQIVPTNPYPCKMKPSKIDTCASYVFEVLVNVKLKLLFMCIPYIVNFLLLSVTTIYILVIIYNNIFFSLF